MVQITHALIRDEASGKQVKIAAATFDKDTDGKKVCQCPDPHCGAVLTHYKSYMQTFYDLDTNEPYKLKIPAHFKRLQGGPPHDQSCTAVDDYTIFQSYARDIGGLSQQHGAFVYNLNIMTDGRPAPVRAPKLASAFEGAVEIRENKNGNGHDAANGHRNGNGHSYERRKLSEGLNHVQRLAGLLDHTEFDRQYRDSILLRDGKRRYTLANLFENDVVRLFRAEHARAKNGADAGAVLFQFKPIVLGKYHKKKDLTIQGQPVTMRDPQGHVYSVCAKLHCGSKEIYDSLKEQIRSGKRSFLIYTDRAYVDLLEFKHKKIEIHEGKAKDRSVFVHLHATMPQQVAAWTPFNGQLDLEVAGMDLPIYRKPPREIPENLIK